MWPVSQRINKIISRTHPQTSQSAANLRAASLSAVQDVSRLPLTSPRVLRTATPGGTHRRRLIRAVRGVPAAVTDTHALLFHAAAARAPRATGGGPLRGVRASAGPGLRADGGHLGSESAGARQPHQPASEARSSSAIFSATRRTTRTNWAPSRPIRPTICASLAIRSTR